MTKKKKRNKRRYKKRDKLTTLIAVGIVILVLVLLTLGVFLLYDSLKDNITEYTREQQQKNIERNHPLEYTEFVYKYADEYGVPRSVVLAVIKTESKFDPLAVSHANAKGLMQLTEGTYNDIKRWLGESDIENDIYDPETNIRYGTYYLSRLYNNYFQNWELVYAAYNAGPNRVLEWLDNEEYAENGILVNIPYPETEDYVKKVSQAREKYLELYDLGEENEGT